MIHYINDQPKGQSASRRCRNDKLIGDVAEILQSECTSCPLGEQTLELKQYSTHEYQTTKLTETLLKSMIELIVANVWSSNTLGNITSCMQTQFQKSVVVQLNYTRSTGHEIPQNMR